jgi:hypothetical protein
MNTSIGIRTSFLAALVFAFTAMSAMMAYPQTLLVPATCSSNQPTNWVYTEWATDADTVTARTANWVTSPYGSSSPVFYPVWDLRYTNPVLDYNSSYPYGNYADHLSVTGISGSDTLTAWAVGSNASLYDGTGSIAQVKCVNGYLVFGTMVNGWDSPSQSVGFGGPQATWGYGFFNSTNGVTIPASAPRPFTSGGIGNVIFQGYFTTPYHQGSEGGQVSFNIFFSRISDPHDYINYVITVYASNYSGLEEINRPHNFVQSAIRGGTNYTTQSQYSATSTYTGGTIASEGWPTFYRVMISYQNMVNLLAEWPKPGDPTDWALTGASVQYEFTGDYTQTLSGSVQAFEIYYSDSPVGF